MGESLEMFQCTEGVILSGFVTMAGRTSGETVKAPKGQMNSFWGTVTAVKSKNIPKELPKPPSEMCGEMKLPS